MNMYDVIIQQIANMKAQYAGLLGAAGAGIFAAAVEFFAWQRDQDREDREDLHELRRKLAALEAELAALPSHPSALSRTSGTSTSVTYVSTEKQVILEKVLTALQVALRTPVANSHFVSQGNLGTSPTVTLITSGATGELNQAGNFALRLTAGSGSTAAGAQARFTPPVPIKGPVRIRLTPAPTANVVEGLKPYYLVNYATDGVTVNSVDICTATAPTASTSYDIQVSIEPAPVGQSTGISSEFGLAEVHASDATHAALLNVL